jgi:DNA polymerase-3 subunit epsilon
MMSKIIYNSWDHVPSGLKTKTQLAREGMKSCKGQVPVAYKRGFRRSPHYALYDAALAIPKRKPTQAQLATLAANREKQRCMGCDKLVFDQLLYKRCSKCAKRYGRHLAATTHANEAIHWARAMLQSNALILDTETTGLDDAAEIIEVALIDTQGSIYWNTRLRPRATSWPDAQAIHGIAPVHVAHACTLPQMYNALTALLAQHEVVIYNAAFDTRLLAQSCAAWNLAPIAFIAHCAMNQYTNYHKQKRWLRLPAGDHTALGDCWAVLRVLHQMANSALYEVEDLP